MSGKNIAYIILFLLVLVVPPFGVLFGFIMIIVHYMERSVGGFDLPEKKEPVMSWEDRQALKLAEAEASAKRNRERNMTIKSDPKGE